MKFYVILAAALMLGSAVSLATDSSATGAAAPVSTKGACAADREKFCANVEKGKGKIRECLTQHSAELSDGCKAHLAEHASKAN